MKLPVVVVYKTTYRKKEKFHLKVFRDVYVDDVISTTKRKPLKSIRSLKQLKRKRPRRKQ